MPIAYTIHKMTIISILQGYKDGIHQDETLDVRKIVRAVKSILKKPNPQAIVIATGG
jgi:hypothetical protein